MTSSDFSHSFRWIRIVRFEKREKHNIEFMKILLIISRYSSTSSIKAIFNNEITSIDRWFTNGFV